MPTGPRSHPSGYFFFSLDGVNAGLVHSMGGGAISGEVVRDPLAHDYFVRKHIGQVKYEDFSLGVGFSMTKAVYDWIAASWKGNYQRKDGSLRSADYNLNVKSEREFFGALITETSLPAADASSKEPAYMTIKFSPEYIRYKRPTGKVSSSLGKGAQKKWLPANFRLEIDGLDCTRVGKVDSFTVKQAVVRGQVGERRDYLLEPGKLDFPDLKVTLAENASGSWFDWFEDFVIKGNNADENEKNGSLTFLAPDRKDELAEVRFFGLGISRLTAVDPEPQADQIAKIVAELYCERMEFVYPAS